MFGFIEISVAGLPMQIWQRVDDGTVTGFVDANGDPIDLPQPCEYDVRGDLIAALPGQAV